MAGYEQLAGLEVQPDQTFGIEFELAYDRGGWHRAWETVAKEILQRLGRVVPCAAAPVPIYAGRKDVAVWNVEPDASCDFEITTRILQGEDGFTEVADACKVIAEVCTEFGLGVNQRTGTHLHLGWSRNLDALRRLIELVAFYEPALYSLVAPSRAENRYTTSVRRHLLKFRRLRSELEWQEALRRLSRYLGVNLTNLFDGYGTVEIRMHSGTVEAPKILTWASLWMNILGAAERGVAPPGDAARRLSTRPLSSGVRGDVLALARVVGARDGLLARLADRRDHVVRRSWCSHETYGPLARRLLNSAWASTTAGFALHTASTTDGFALQAIG
jgi:hypothetical protein